MDCRAQKYHLVGLLLRGGLADEAEALDRSRGPEVPNLLERAADAADRALAAQDPAWTASTQEDRARWRLWGATRRPAGGRIVQTRDGPRTVDGRPVNPDGTVTCYGVLPPHVAPDLPAAMRSLAAEWTST